MPETVGPFRLLRVLRSDASATVHEALGPDGQERLALTVLAADEVSLDARSHEALRAAVRAAAPILHPNLILPQDLVRDGTRLLIAAPYTDGETFDRYLARAGRLPPLQGLALLAQLLDGLACAGRHRWVHSAIHPRHLLVAPNGQPRIDGSAGVAAACTRRPGPFDSPQHLAPEVAQGAPPDPRADLYSAAVVAYELLTGALPWEGADRTIVRPVRSLRPELPAELDAVFGRALATSPDARFASAAQLWSALHAAVGSPVWVRPRAPARSAAPVVAVARDTSPTRPSAVAVPAVPEDGASVAPLTHRAALALMVGCTAIASWTAGLWTPEPVQRAAERVLASQAMPASGFTAHVPTVPSSDVGGATRPPIAAMSTPAAAPAQPVSDPPRPATHEQEATAPAARHDDLPVDPPDEASSASARPAPHRTRIRSHAHPGPRPQPTSTSTDLPCDSREGFARELCTVLRCATAEFRTHPVCVRLHREGEARLQLAASRGAP